MVNDMNDRGQNGNRSLPSLTQNPEDPAVFDLTPELLST